METNKNAESLNKNIESLKEENRKNLESLKEDNRKNAEKLCQVMKDSFKKLREDLKESFEKTRDEIRNDNKPETEEIPKEENMEQMNPKTEDNGIKDQIIKKTEGRRMIRPKKVRLTWEILEMTRNGLIYFINHPIIDHRIITNGKKYDKNLIKALEVNESPCNREKKFYQEGNRSKYTQKKKYSSTDQ